LKYCINRGNKKNNITRKLSIRRNLSYNLKNNYISPIDKSYHAPGFINGFIDQGKENRISIGRVPPKTGPFKVSFLDFLFLNSGAPLVREDDNSKTVP
jgi:hypothetical protein